jgi:hypothetical protein
LKFNLGIFLPQRLGVLSIKVNTSPANYRGYNQMQLVKFDGTRWVPFGDIIGE